MTYPLPRKAQQYHPELNMYVPNCQYVADLDSGAAMRLSFGTPALSAAAGILSAQSINAAVTVQRASLLSYQSDARYGRNLRFIASGAATSTVDIYGRDFWGQPMRETVTLTGAVSVVSVKCFYILDRLVFGLTAATTVDVGWGALVGLPYKAVKVLSEEADGVPATVGTLTAPALTDPQIATTSDPRGKYTPNTAFDGSKEITALFIFDNSANSTGNGGYFGIQHVGS